MLLQLTDGHSDIALTFRPERCDNGSVNGNEFIRRARRHARKTKQEFRLDSRQGKGSHQTIRIGTRRTLVQHGEISAGILASMLKDLSINRGEF